MATQDTEQSPLLGEHQALANGRHIKKKSAPVRPEGYELYLVLASPYAASLLAAIDSTMTSTVSATIAAEFSSLDIVSWLGIAYLVALAAIQPVSGKLTDRYGRRAGMLLALICFALGNLLCGVAQSTFVLITGRLVAGAGGGAMCSICTFVTTDMVPLRKRTVWQGFGDIVWSVGMGVGGSIGGLINDRVGWRWAFLGIVPLTLLVMLTAYLTLRLPPIDHTDEGGKPASRHIDLAGAASLTGMVVTLIIGLNLVERGEKLAISVVLLVTAFLLLLTFVIVETRFATDPIIPVQLLANRSVLSVCLSNLFISASMYSLLFYVPLLIQVRGYNTTETGLQLLGEPLGASTGSFATGVVMRVLGAYGPVKPVVLGVYLAAPLGYTLSDLDTRPWVTVLTLMAMGAGFSSVSTLLLTGLLAVTEHRIQASSTSMLYAFRQVGSTTGLAIAGILFRFRVVQETIETFGAGKIPLENVASKCDRHRYVDGVRPDICVVYGSALHTVFLYTLVLACVGVVCGMLMKNVPLDREEDVPT